MKRLSVISVFFALLFITQGVSAQTPQPGATPPDDDEVVKISTTLIQMDVIVTDKKGNQVTDLKPEDFEIYENGKKQKITNFSYIVTGNPAAKPDASANVSNPGSRNNVPVPPVKLKPEQVRRTYALVVDDLGLSFESVVYVKKSLKKFIDEQMQEGDLVAIIRTGGGIGSLQSFTNDKRQLYAAIEKVRWNSYGRSGISPFEAITTTLKEDLSGTIDSNGNVTSVAGTEEDNVFARQVEEFRQDNFSSGTLSALRFIIKGMSELPGRKSVILFSDGFKSLTTENGITRANQIFTSLRILADYANRASVVFYTLDPRGLQIPGMANANDVVREVLPDSFDPGDRLDSNPLAIRERDFRDSQQTLRYLAHQTGGIPFVNQNSLDKGLQKVVEDQSGYYLIAYEPDEETFDPDKSRYNALAVKVLRDGAKVRYRSGFFGIPTENIAPVKQTVEQQVYTALISPFGASDISLNLNAMFAEDAKNGMFIQSLVFIEGRDLKFTDEANGTKKANFDIVAMTFGDNGQPIDEASKNYTIRVSEKNYRKLLENGFIYSLVVPVKKPGAYQFRVVLRDSATAKVGSVSQFIDIPDLKKKRLTLSSIVLNGYTAVEWQKIRSGEKTGSSQTGEDGLSAGIDTALRRFKRGTVLQYGYIIYNASAKGNQSRQLEIRARLMRDGRVVLEGDPAAFIPGVRPDPRRIETGGAITLGRNLVPGNYVLQIIVTDKNAKDKYATTTRWVEFEIVE